MHNNKLRVQFPMKGIALWPCRWRQLPIGSVLNVILLVCRQYILAFIAVALVYGAVYLTFKFATGMKLPSVITSYMSVFYIVLAEESARWIYAYHTNQVIKNVISFTVIFVILEGSLKVYMKHDYFSSLSIWQIAFTVVFIYSIAELIHYLNGILVIISKSNALHVRVGFFILAVVLHFFINATVYFQNVLSSMYVGLMPILGWP